MRYSGFHVWFRMPKSLNSDSASFLVRLGLGRGLGRVSRHIRPIGCRAQGWGVSVLGLESVF